MQQIVEPVRLIIWDLDNTFWSGTLSEGGIRAFNEENHKLVPSLASRGIMSSICSKNERDAVRVILEKKGLWNYFIFPSIDWTAKGARVAALVETVGLRPQTVMFIDDNPSNLAEVAAAVPGILVADANFVRAISGHPMFAGKDDVELTRLAQYKLLEQKKHDALTSPLDNTEFLRDCNIQVILEYDVEKHIERVVELVNRTNQLNFTKRRLPDDDTLARAEALNMVRHYGHQAALVKVTDKYGDYGFVGFYMKLLDTGMHTGTLLHFCFSCRTLGMGVEQWVYQMLGKPPLRVVGEVVSEVKSAAPVTWINQTSASTASPGAGRRLTQFSEIRLRGGCEIAALAHYFKLAGPVTCVETNYTIDDIFIIKQDLSTNFVNALLQDDNLNSELGKLGFPPDGLTSAFLAPVSGPTLLVLDLWGELYVPLYRHKDLGFFVHVTLQGFMGWADNHAGGDLAAWTEEQLNAEADTLRLAPAARARLFDVVGELRRNYVFAGVIDAQAVKANLRVIAERIPAGANLVFVLPSGFSPDGSPRSRNTSHTEWCIQELQDRPNVCFVNIDQAINSVAERNEIGDHFDRIVYYRLAEQIMTLLAPPQPGGSTLTSGTHAEETTRGPLLRRPTMRSEAWPSIEKSDQPPSYALVTASISGEIDALGKAVRDAFQDAMAMRGRLSEEAFHVDGFSGRKFRLFLNNLMSEVPNPRYMEIGVFHGASFCSALWKNKLRAVGIDNWTEYDGKRQVFMDNLAKFRSAEADVEIIEEDFHRIDYGNIGKFNILFYDGPHTEKDQYEGISLPQPAMDDQQIVVVDDWNWSPVRRATFDALRDLHLDIDYSIELRTTFNDEALPVVHGQNSEWHNGSIVAVVSRRS
jgi:FkbH-like protein